LQSLVRQMLVANGWGPDEMHKAFQEFDRDGDGTIDRSEFFFLAKNILHLPLPKTELQKLWKEVDLSGTGSVEFQDFASIIFGEDDEGDEDPAKAQKQAEDERLAELDNLSDELRAQMGMSPSELKRRGPPTAFGVAEDAVINAAGVACHAVEDAMHDASHAMEHALHDAGHAVAEGGVAGYRAIRGMMDFVSDGFGTGRKRAEVANPEVVPRSHRPDGQSVVYPADWGKRNKASADKAGTDKSVDADKPVADIPGADKASASAAAEHPSGTTTASMAAQPSASSAAGADQSTFSSSMVTRNSSITRAMPAATRRASALASGNIRRGSAVRRGSTATGPQEWYVRGPGMGNDLAQKILSALEDQAAARKDVQKRMDTMEAALVDIRHSLETWRNNSNGGNGTNRLARKDSFSQNLIDSRKGDLSQAKDAPPSSRGSFDGPRMPRSLQGTRGDTNKIWSDMVC